MARTFDGVDDQIAFGSETAVVNLTAFTASALVYVTANITTERQILTKMRADYLGKLFLFFQGNDETNRVKTYISLAGGTACMSETLGSAFSLNTWTVFVSTWAGFGNAPKLYICALGGAIAEPTYNLQQVGTGTSVDSDAPSEVRVGARNAADATFYAHSAAECALWNRVLTLREIHALGRGFTPGFFPRGRVFYTPIDGRHSPEINYAGTTHGTLTGTTYFEHPRVLVPSTPMSIGVSAVTPSAVKPDFSNFPKYKLRRVA